MTDHEKGDRLVTILRRLNERPIDIRGGPPYELPKDGIRDALELGEALEIANALLSVVAVPNPASRRRRRETDSQCEARLRGELLAALDAYVGHVRTSS